MQTLQLLHRQSMRIGPVGQWHRLMGALNFTQRVRIRLLHHLLNRLPDQVTVGQAGGVGFCQVLLDGVAALALARVEV